MLQTIETTHRLGGPSNRHGVLRRALRGAIHFLSYHFILKRNRTAFTRAAGFRLVVHFALLGSLIEQAGFRARPVRQRTILIEAFIMYELHAA